MTDREPSPRHVRARSALPMALLLTRQPVGVVGAAT
jgi:hypothetical protein